jgi:asparagine synthase (glutamine-hydrolysing)
MGDAMMGSTLIPQHWAVYAPATTPQVQLQIYADQDRVAFHPAQQPEMLTPVFQRRLNGALLESFEQSLALADTSDPGDQRNHFNVVQRFRRMALNGAEVVRGWAVVRLPFCDRDLLDLSLQVPPGLRMQRHLSIRAFTLAFPELSKVPCTMTGLPLIACAREVTMRGQELARWHLQRVGLGRLAGPPRRPYKDYGAWFRTVLRPWVEETLLDRRALERGYFNPGFVRQLVLDHMAGQDHSVQLGVLLSLELWHRQFLD